MSPGKQSLSFMELVELHERKWGTTQYPGRPGLQALLSSPIVALWAYQKRFIFSVHNAPHELNDIVDSLVRTNEVSLFRECSLAKIFVHQQPIEFHIGVMAVKDKKSESDAQEMVSNPDSMPIDHQRERVPFPRKSANHSYVKYGEHIPTKRPHLHGRMGNVYRYMKSPRPADDENSDGKRSDSESR